ncbi:MAG: PDZ domain-containing protein [Gemmatimonadaceae bacterium]
MRAGLLISAVASATLAAGLNAQGTPPKADSTCTKYSDGRVECRVYRRTPGDSARRNMVFFKMDSAMANRAALGLELRATGTKRDTLGVFVEAVTPKGPAEGAGIVEGDRIASINGVDVRTSVADAEDEYANEVASRRLSREVRKLTPGTRVTLRVYSGGRFRDVQVTTGKASEVMRLSNQFYRMPMNGMRIDGPGAMMFTPDMQLMRERMPMMKERLEPMLRERMENLEPMLREQLRDLPRRIELRTAPRFKTAMPMGRVTTLDDEAGFDEALVLDLDDLPFDFDSEVAPISPGEIRELVGIAAQDARAALKHLAADGTA